MDLAAAFLRTAEDDLRAARVCLAARSAPAAAFFAQQAGEKAAKGWLLAHGYRAGRTHYTTPMLVRALALEGGGSTAALRDAVNALHDLEEYAAGARYPAHGQRPGTYEPPSARIDAQEARTALRKARSVVVAFAGAARWRA